MEVCDLNSSGSLVYRLFYGREIDELFFYETWMIGLLVAIILLLYQILKSIDAIKGDKREKIEDDFEVL